MTKELREARIAVRKQNDEVKKIITSLLDKDEHIKSLNGKISKSSKKDLQVLQKKVACYRKK